MKGKETMHSATCRMIIGQSGRSKFRASHESFAGAALGLPRGTGDIASTFCSSSESKVLVASALGGTVYSCEGEACIAVGSEESEARAMG
jgi:hypothetical protein